MVDDGEEQLSNLLREWMVDAEVPPGMAERVRSRVREDEASKSEPGEGLSLWGMIRRWFADPLARPVAAIAVVVFAAVGGATLAQIHGAKRNAEMTAELKLKYLRSVHPFVEAETESGGSRGVDE